MLWILLILLVVVLFVALAGGVAYRGRAGGGAGVASPQTTIIERDRPAETTRSQTTTVTRETETTDT
jgi:flagellar basal body-associated protein FliL